MKYASEVIDLLAPYPGRKYRMAHIVRHVTKGRALSMGERHAVREGVKRVLRQLSESGQVQQIKSGETFAVYAWRCELQHEVLANCNVNCNNTGRDFAP